MKYKVHIYAVVSVPVLVEAENHKEAVRKAEEETDLHKVLDTYVRLNIQDEVMYTDVIDGYWIEEVENISHKNSKYYKVGEI